MPLRSTDGSENRKRDGLLPGGGGSDLGGAEAVHKNVAIVIYEGVEVLDFAGPAEVFEAASGYGASGEEPAFEV